MTRADYACDLQRTAADFSARARDRYHAFEVDPRDVTATIRTQRVAAQAYAEARAVLGIEVVS